MTSREVLPIARTRASVPDRPARSPTPSAVATDCASGASSCSESSSIRSTRAYRPGSPLANSSASRVLPTPPAPVSVSKRDVLSRVRRTESSWRRPTKESSARGSPRPESGGEASGEVGRFPLEPLCIERLLNARCRHALEQYRAGRPPCGPAVSAAPHNSHVLCQVIPDSWPRASWAKPSGLIGSAAREGATGLTAVWVSLTCGVLFAASQGGTSRSGRRGICA